jgi:predicted kinase
MDASPSRPADPPERGPELALLIGLPASGKTTFYQQRLATTHAHVSRDVAARQRGDPKTRQRALAVAALEAGRSVAIDNTNARGRERAEWVAFGRAHGARIVGYAFDADTQAAVARNRRREGAARVPPAAIFVTAKRWEAPRWAEGFDALFQVRIPTDGEFEVTPAPPDPS